MTTLSIDNELQLHSSRSCSQLSDIVHKFFEEEKNTVIFIKKKEREGKCICNMFIMNADKRLLSSNKYHR